MSKHSNDGMNKLTVSKLKAYKEESKKISMLTAYDYTMASLLDKAGIDMILVGDSAANVMAGHSTTLPITIEQMIYHGASVVKAVNRSFVVVDMPFGSYQVGKQQAIESAIRIMKETGADAVKLEGGEYILDSIRAIVSSGIPVVGHLGLTPQSVHILSGYGLRAKDNKESETLKREAKLLQEAGCSFLVLEKIPKHIASEVSKSLDIPVIGIGAGNEVDGQVLVLQDMLGMNNDFKPKFLRCFSNIGDQVVDAVSRYIESVRTSDFPNDGESY